MADAPRSQSRSGQGRARRAKKEVSAGGVVFRRRADGPRFLLIRDSYGHWGFPKGHLESGETPAQAAMRETTEETGLEALVLHRPLDTIDWYFRLRGKLIHKFCHFFLLESEVGEPTPQQDEGITECAWFTLDEAVAAIGYQNARGVLRGAGEVTRAVLEGAEPGS
ncbi:MAG: NUDIX hydrolase [Gemmatimonadales bacterium]|nr:NUDIX hydrolase [Gemmatimonadales bacterium]